MTKDVSKPKIVSARKVIKFPRSLKSVMDILERMTFRAKEVPLDLCVIIARRKDGGMIVMHNKGDFHRVLGVLEDGRDMIKDRYSEVDEDDEYSDGED